MKEIFLKKFVALILAFSCYLIAFSSTATLAVGDSFRCDATSAVQGLTSDVSWSTSGGYLTLSGSGFYRDVQVTKYFSGEATVICQWKYRLYSGDQYRTQRKEWTISCVDNRISITPTSMSLQKGEVKKIISELSYDTKGHPTIAYVSNNPKVASVSSDGFVKAVSRGNAIISVSSNYGSNTMSCSVEVDGGGSDSNDNNSSNIRTIHVDVAGTLNSLISSSDVYSITDLKLSGRLNGSDLRILRRMTGRDENRQITNGKLKNLDLRDVIFVHGGAWYFDVYDTKHFVNGYSELPDYLFAWGPVLESIKLPRTLSFIGYWSFHMNDNLRNVEIPTGVDKIYENFLYCKSLKKLILPSTIEYIRLGYLGQKYTSLYCYAPEPPETDSNDRFEEPEKKTLYVPKGTSDKYWAVEPWNTVGNIVEMDQEPTYPMNLSIETINGEVLVNGERFRKLFDENMYGSGFYCLDLKKDETVSLELIPDAGYKVKSLSYVDDLTDKIVDGKINITNANKEIFYNRVTVVFDKIPTGIEKSEDNYLNVYKNGQRIIIENSNKNDLIEIYSISGTKIKSINSNGSSMSIPVDNKFYLVKIGHKTFKVL